jgi:hypothetical protein
MTPLGLIVRPDGKLPDEILHVYGGNPPVAANVWA